jgi:UDP-glucose 4-epimerase
MNIACGERISLNELVRQINRLAHKDVKPRYEPGRAGDVKHSLADIHLARELIGYQPKVMFAEGLERTLAWYQAQR